MARILVSIILHLSFTSSSKYIEYSMSWQMEVAAACHDSCGEDDEQEEPACWDIYKFSEVFQMPKHLAKTLFKCDPRLGQSTNFSQGLTSLLAQYSWPMIYMGFLYTSYILRIYGTYLWYSSYFKYGTWQDQFPSVTTGFLAVWWLSHVVTYR